MIMVELKEERTVQLPWQNLLIYSQTCRDDALVLCHRTGRPNYLTSPQVISASGSAIAAVAQARCVETHPNPPKSSPPPKYDVVTALDDMHARLKNAAARAGGAGL